MADKKSLLRQRWGSRTPPVPVYSKLKITVALKSLGAWEDVKAWLEANDYYDYFVMAQDFRADNEYFAAALAALKERLGWTDEQVDALLAECAAD